MRTTLGVPREGKLRSSNFDVRKVHQLLRGAGRRVRRAAALFVALLGELSDQNATDDGIPPKRGAASATQN